MNEASEILMNAFVKRQAKDPTSSQSAFAQELGMSPQQLSNVMAGRRGLSLKSAERVVAKLNLDQYQKSVFIESVKANFSLSKTQRVIARSKLNELQAAGSVKALDTDLFNAISNWHHLALVELIRISQKKRMTISFFSKKLGISENEVGLTLNRLERMDLISKSPLGWKVNQDVVIFDRAVPNAAIKNFHRQVLEKSILALDFQNSDERYGSTSAIPVKFKSIERAKKIIQDFRDSLSKEVADREEGEAIYALSIQFFNLTTVTKEQSI